MRGLIPSLAALLPATALAQSYTPVYGNSTPEADADGKYTITAEGIRAQFIPYGASISNLFINDTNGIERDVVMGFDNASYYSIDTRHPFLGGIPGRYANRIKNSSFEIDGETYNVIPNENDGKNTLHGGPNGWDWRNWTVVSYASNSITFSLVDPDGEQGFPGQVVAYATYTVTPYKWHMRMTATSTQKKTPIMMTSHTYWNLDGFQNPNTPQALNHTLSLPYSGQRIGVDGILIPDGTILPNVKGSVNDFWSEPKQVGRDFWGPEAVGNCGTGCRGYDNAYVVNRAQEGPYDWRTKGPVATLASPFTGIQVDVYSDQDAYQIYSCGGENGTLPLKRTQGFFDDEDRPRTVQQYGCIVMEVEDWIGAINQPQWQRERKNIFGPGDGQYVLESVHEFKLNRTLVDEYEEATGGAPPSSSSSSAAVAASAPTGLAGRRRWS